MSEPQGIDVSNIQGARFPWAGERGRISFGMAKATEGLTFTDPDFPGNWNAMWWLQPDHRLPRFAYHYFHAGQDPVAQARFFVAAVKAHGLLPGDNLVADFESTDPDTGLNDGVAPLVFSARGRTFLQEVNTLAPGHRVLVYMNPSFAEAGHSFGMGPWYLWVANYGVSRPAVPAPWSAWTFWQSGDNPVDTDVFNGTEDALLAFTRMPDKRP